MQVDPFTGHKMIVYYTSIALIVILSLSDMNSWLVFNVMHYLVKLCL